MNCVHVNTISVIDSLALAHLFAMLFNIDVMDNYCRHLN